MKLNNIKRILTIDIGVLVIKLQNDKYVIVYSTKHKRLFYYLYNTSMSKRMEYASLKLRIKAEKDNLVKSILFEELTQLNFFCGI